MIVPFGSADSPNRGRRRRVVAALATACLLFAVAARPADGVRVLAFETVAAKSHWNFMRGVLLALADGGHRVTVYTPFADRDAPPVAGYTEVDTSADFDTDTTVVSMNATDIVPLFADTSYFVPFLGGLSRFACDLMDGLLAGRGADEFDVFVTEPLTDECASHTARRLGVPLVYTVPAPLMPWIETGVFGHVANPAHAPHMFSARSTVDDTFYARLSNVAMHVYTAYKHYRYASAAAAREDRPYDRVPPVNPAVMFVNTHYAVEHGRPVPVNRVDVGGIHLKKPKPLPAVIELGRLVPINRVDVGGIHLKKLKPLPADILDFIENSPHGIILMSFGTVVTLSSLPDDIQKSFIDAIAEVPQGVLMKYEGEIQNKPKNLMTSKWLPQRDILRKTMEIYYNN